MRDIKFRAWDKKNKVMLDNVGFQYTDVGLLIKPEIGMIFVGSEEERSSHYEGRYGTDHELMQYTGLKDKNGKEIFEGDIVKEEQYMSNDLISEVRFYEGRFDSLVRVKEGYNCIDQYSPESFEVIGNIHEHSHLLGVTKQP